MRRTKSAIKADAAERVFGLSTRDQSWAVIGDGIDATHPAFYVRKDDGVTPAPAAPTEGGFEIQSRVVATYDFTRFEQWAKAPDEAPEFPGIGSWQAVQSNLGSGRTIPWDVFEPALRVPHDERYGETVGSGRTHATHVAGILAANWPEESLAGVCPDLRLYDFRVLSGDRGGEQAVLAALDFARWMNTTRGRVQIHGVDVDVAVSWDEQRYACGESLVCLACEDLVRSGVVVVAPAGNNGRLHIVTNRGTVPISVHMGITDPGNAESVITVGATHNWEGVRYAPSYFSSRGPTVDGRHKPDIVAPGEQILGPVPGGGIAKSAGTSMAAAHVAGAAALLMARNSGLIGNPELVKQILCNTATDLGKDRNFQGAGMVDVLRALQSV